MARLGRSQPFKPLTQPENLTFAGGVVNGAVAQIAATLTASGGTQAVATINDVSITQAAATLTLTGGTQVVQQTGLSPNLPLR